MHGLVASRTGEHIGVGGGCTVLAHVCVECAAMRSCCSVPCQGRGVVHVRACVGHDCTSCMHAGQAGQ